MGRFLSARDSVNSAQVRRPSSLNTKPGEPDRIGCLFQSRQANERIDQRGKKRFSGRQALFPLPSTSCSSEAPIYAGLSPPMITSARTGIQRVHWLPAFRKTGAATDPLPPALTSGHQAQRAVSPDIPGNPPDTGTSPSLHHDVRALFYGLYIVMMFSFS